MPYRDTLAAREALLAVASRQGGYVTAAQAGEAGFGPSHLAYHARAGLLERVGHGLYRVASLPHDEHDELIRLALWSRDRQGRPQAVVSHDSALALHELSDVMPSRIHLSVPPRFRKLSPPGCRLHVARVPDDDRTPWTVFCVTRPGRTLADAADSRSVTTEMLQAAVREALQRGLVTVADLERRAEEGANSRLTEALRVARRG